MQIYKCGYCGKQVAGDIWCSEQCRRNWYASVKMQVRTEKAQAEGRRGPRYRLLRRKKRKGETNDHVHT